MRPYVRSKYIIFYFAAINKICIQRTVALLHVTMHAPAAADPAADCVWVAAQPFQHYDGDTICCSIKFVVILSC